MPNQQPSNSEYNITNNIGYGFPQEGGPKKAVTDPYQVINKLTEETGGYLPLFKTLNNFGIVRPNELKVFAEYVKGFGGYSNKLGDFVIPKDKVPVLWNQMKNDKGFQARLDMERLKGIKSGIEQTRQYMSDPQIASQFSDEAKRYLSDQLNQLMQQGREIAQHVTELVGPAKQVGKDLINTMPGPFQAVEGMVDKAMGDTPTQVPGQDVSNRALQPNRAIDINLGTPEGDPHSPKLEQGQWTGKFKDLL